MWVSVDPWWPDARRGYAASDVHEKAGHLARDDRLNAAHGRDVSHFLRGCGFASGSGSSTLGFRSTNLPLIGKADSVTL